MLLREGVFQMEWLQNRWLTMFYVSKRGGARKYISHWLSPSFQKALWLGKCVTLSSLLRFIFGSGIFISLNLSLRLCLPHTCYEYEHKFIQPCSSLSLKYVTVCSSLWGLGSRRAEGNSVIGNIKESWNANAWIHPTLDFYPVVVIADARKVIDTPVDTLQQVRSPCLL